MTKRMLVDAMHPEETRVAIVDGNWLSDFDFERASKKQLKGNIYLAKVIRVEPSLQAAFVEYGGNRHGFLPFSEIHPDYFRIPMADRPHDAPEEDEDDDAPEETLPPEALAAHAEDHHDDHHHEEHADVHHDEQHEPAVAADVPQQDYAAPIPAQEFTPEASADLGLITDFGNAVVPPSMPMEAATPVETVGGEVAEEEQRIRRQPRIRYKIQEVIKRRQVMLIQVVKEERGNKGAALTTFLSLAGRYCVLMPNTDHGGGVSRKITSHQDRRRMKEMLDQLEVPEGMAVILRTAGMEQTPAEIQRDLEYLLRLWNNIREQTLQSTAPTLIYEEANLIKRSMRDLYAPDLEEILVAGARGHQLAIDFMRTIMPDQLDKVKLYEDSVPLFFRYNVERQIDQLYSPTVQLRSGGYIVINPTEALVSIDVNSGRATRERHIEGTALKTNLEAAEEIARQLRLRDLAGLVVIDFIDMEDGRNNAAVERRLKEAMRADRARLQIGRISPFGLLELSRQRLHPSLMEINFEKCPHCAGVGLVRSVDSAAISILRLIEEEGIRQGSAELVVHVPPKVALYILNQKRAELTEIERRYNLQVLLHSEESLVPPDYRLERARNRGEGRDQGPAVNTEQVFTDTNRDLPLPPPRETSEVMPNDNGNGGYDNQQPYQQQGGHGRRRGRFGFGRNRNNNNQQNYQQQNQQPYAPHPDQQAAGEANGNQAEQMPSDDNDNIGNVEGGHQQQGNYQGQGGYGQQQNQQRPGGRRRGRRGGRGRRNGGGGGGGGGGDRGLRNNNYQPRHDQRHDNWNRNQGQSEQTANPTPSHVPSSVHDLDTTPREDRQPSVQQTYSAQAAPRADRQASPPPYEVVESSDSSDKPKGGWWRKLTGQ